MKISLASLVLALTTTASAAELLADASAYAPIKTRLNLGFCLAATSTADSAAVIIAPCDGSDLQAWLPLQDRTNVFRFQNRASRLCLWDIDTIAPGQVLFQGECTLSDGSGNTVSNAEWDTNGPQLPNTSVQLRSFVHFRDNNLCITVGFGTSVILDNCGGLTSQLWEIDG